MHSAEIERRLRLPAPDEPRILPALVLPAGGAAEAATPRIRWRARRESRPLWPRLGFAMLLLLGLLISAVVGGLIRIDRMLELLDPNAPFRGNGISIEVPAGWTRLVQQGPFSQTGASTVLLATSASVEGCTAEDMDTGPQPTPVFTDGGYVMPDQTGQIPSVEDRIYACVIELPLADGETRMVVAAGIPQITGVGPFGDFLNDELFDEAGGPGFSPGWYFPTEEDGWTETIDSMPAKLVVAETSVTPGAREVRTWVVMPGNGGPWPWYIQFVIGADDMDAARQEADETARSLRFDQHLPDLDPATRDAVLAEAIDAADREARRYPGTDLYACFPRTPGARTVTVEEGPFGPLLEPAEVTCTTTIEETSIYLWRATLVITWEAQNGTPAGSWGQERLFDGALGNRDSGGGGGQLGDNDGSSFPGMTGPPAPPLAGPMNIPAGSLIRVVPPGVSQLQSPITELWQSGEPFPGDPEGLSTLVDAYPGSRYFVVEGPVVHLGVEWYRVQAATGADVFGGWTAWLPATDGQRPLVEVVEPRCAGDARATWTVDDLIDLLPAERVACFGDRSITIDPATVVFGDPFFEPPDVEATPEWLAGYREWRAYGAEGPNGVEPALAFAIHPDLGDKVPTGTWLRITGHFDDPASSTCDRDRPEDGSWVREIELIRMECSQLFVVTGTEPRSAP